jgi:hypothetical protein
MTSIWGSLFFCMATTLLNFAHQGVLATILLDIGWCAMVTGFSCVLYSRLHILNPNKRFQRIILICIIVNAILFHGPVIVATIIGNIHFSKITSKVFDVASFTEVAFSVQETALSTYYIYLFLQFTKDSRGEIATERTLSLLFCAESVILSVDVVLNVLLYKRLYLPRAMIQAFSSMLKLKIEYIVLNSLVDFAESRSRMASRIAGSQSWHSNRTDIEQSSSGLNEASASLSTSPTLSFPSTVSSKTS